MSSVHVPLDMTMYNLYFKGKYIYIYECVYIYSFYFCKYSENILRAMFPEPLNLGLKISKKNCKKMPEDM